jgi:NADPH2:quinone reductase
MKAATLVSPGVVEARDAPMPEPGPNDVLVRVRAAGLNRADAIMSTGAMHGAHGGPGTILGIECAGEIERVGADVRGFKPGDRVMCSGGGGFAEYARIPAQRVNLAPATLDWRQAGSMPVAMQTMHDAIVTNGALRPGESVLIQGASSGVGLLGMQIAKAMGARVVLGTSSDAGRRAKLKDFGADVAIDTSDPKWPDHVKEATGGKGVDLIVDMVSGGVANGNLRAAALMGRIVNVGRLGGMSGEFDYDLHALKRIKYIGVTFRTRTIDEVGEVVRRAREDLYDAVAAGKLRLPISSVWPLAKAGEALAHMRANAHFGKIVLEM